MVAVDGEKDGRAPAESVFFYRSALEAGVMDVFFEEGHVIFNGILPEREESSEMQRRYDTVKLAEEGGASYIFLASLQYEVETEGAVFHPKAVVFTFFALSGEKSLYDGKIAVEDITIPEKAGPAEICFLLGKTAGTQTLHSW
jgi:hypothetical protein